MAHKTFISYKYSDGTAMRDAIVAALGPDASFYKGETSASPCMGYDAEGTIRNKLAKMLFDTSVLIVIISPSIDLSAWVPWEISYATSREKRYVQSQPNGVVVAFPDSPLFGSYQKTLDLIKAKSDPCEVKVNYLLGHARACVDEAFQKAQARNG